MQFRIIFIIFLILLSISGLCFGQEIVEDENWLKGLGTEADSFPSLIYQFKTFTQEDVTKGKQRLKSIRQFAPKNEWEGIYYAETGIGDSKLIWNSEGRFFNLYFYHELKRFNYGRVNDSPSFVELINKKPSTSSFDKKQAVKAKLIKIQIDDKHFLVPETRLQDFCDKAAGLSIDLNDFYYYWTKEADMQKETFGLPNLPSEYKPFLRYPIEAKIISVGRKKIIPNEQSTKEFNFDDIHYPASLNAGKNKNIKIGMNFFVEDLGEWIQITKVFQKTSIGFIRRDFNENKQEQCRDSERGSGQVTSCKEIKVGMKVKTKGSF